MFRRLLFLLLIPVVLPAAAQNVYKTEDIPSALKNRSNAVIRDMETVVDMRAPDNVSIKVRQAVTVLNKNGDTRAELVLFYNKNNSIKSIKGIVYDAQGKPISKFNQSNFTDESAISDFSLFEDDRVKHFKPSVTEYPYTIVYEYELKNKQNLIIPDWYASPSPDVSVEKNSYRFVCLPGDKLHIKTYNYPGQTKETKEEKLMSYSWEMTNIPSFQTEPYAPSPENYLTRVKIAPEKFNYYAFSGNYNNWNDLGKWIYTDLLSKRQNLSPETVQMVKSLVNGINDPKEKAKKIYAYMQEKTRYVSVQIGIGGFQPISAAEVDRMGYGDCKGLVNYMQSLLKAADIYSEYCIVYAGNQKRSMDPDFASMDQANHIILCVPFEKDTTWLECTSQTVPFGFLGDFTDDRTVLACTESGGKLLHTPVLSATENKTIRTASLDIDKEGNVKGNMRTRFEGAAYDNCEGLISDSPEEQVKSLKSKYDLDNIEFDKVTFNQLKTSKPATTEHLDLHIRSYVPQTQSRAYLVLNAFNKAKIIDEVTSRTRPVVVNRGFTELDTIQYTLPENFKIESEMENIQIKNDFGSFIVKTTLTGKLLTYSRYFLLKEGHYPAERYKDLVDFISRVRRYDQSKAVFKLN